MKDEDARDIYPGIFDKLRNSFPAVSMKTSERISGTIPCAVGNEESLEGDGYAKMSKISKKQVFSESEGSDGIRGMEGQASFHFSDHESFVDNPYSFPSGVCLINHSPG